MGMHGARAAIPPPPPPPPEPVATPRTARPVPAANANEFRIQDPAGDGAMVKALYRQFVDERKKTGDMAAVSYDNFERLIAQQAKKIQVEKGALAVDFRIESKDGKVSLKAKPVK